MKRENSLLLAAESVSGSVSFDNRSFGGESLDEALLGLVKGGAGVADGDCDELYLPP